MEDQLGTARLIIPDKGLRILPDRVLVEKWELGQITVIGPPNLIGRPALSVEGHMIPCHLEDSREPLPGPLLPLLSVEPFPVQETLHK
jgi:hypothetical protein